MKNKKHIWVTVAMANLCVVALLGVTLRSKILFPLKSIDFKFVLHAHSHFAFGGWITLALMSLMIHELLPDHLSKKKSYQWILWGVLLNAVGMLVSFLCQGYAFFSILFSTLFVFTTYAFSFAFIKDILKVRAEKAITITSISAVICLVLSSVGPFTLAYLMASHSDNSLLYHDSIYTYLHLQYNGFFTLAVFTLCINNFYKNFDLYQLKIARKFATVISISILPTLCISYLWHFPDTWIRYMAIIGCITILMTVYYLATFFVAIKGILINTNRLARNIGFLSIIAFLLKSLLQTGTIIPSLGKLVFGDRAIIVGYLHLVLLGFISLYLISHFLYCGILNTSFKFTKIGVITFTSGVIANEAILMVQGFGNMMMIGNDMYTFLLWGASIWLFGGATLIFISRLKSIKPLNAR